MRTQSKDTQGCACLLFMFCFSCVLFGFCIFCLFFACIFFGRVFFSLAFYVFFCLLFVCIIGFLSDWFISNMLISRPSPVRVHRKKNPNFRLYAFNVLYILDLHMGYIGAILTTNPNGQHATSPSNFISLSKVVLENFILFPSQSWFGRMSFPFHRVGHVLGI